MTPDRGRRAAPPVRDPATRWRILLEARLAGPVDRATIAARWHGLAASQGWPRAVPVVLGDAAPGAGREVVLGSDDPVALAHDGPPAERLWLAAHHDRLDGLGLLGAVAALVEGSVTTDARGVGDRRADRLAAPRRLAEALLRPPARVRADPVAPGDRGHGDVLVEASLDGVHRTADLVHAVARVGARRGDGRPVAVAIGAGRPVAAGEPLGDRSALLRVTGADRLDRDAVAAALRTAAVQPPVAAAGAAGGAAALAQRVLAGRLGSTFLVSHLGVVTAPGLADLLFSPVTGNGGLALGALVLRDRTRLSLRAPAPGWDAATLDGVLAEVVAELSGDPTGTGRVRR